MTASKGEPGRGAEDSDPVLPMPKNDDLRFVGLGRVVSRYADGVDESRLPVESGCESQLLFSLDRRL